MPSPLSSRPSSPYGAPSTSGPLRLPDNAPASSSSSSAPPAVQPQSTAGPANARAPRPPVQRLAADKVHPESIAWLSATQRLTADKVHPGSIAWLGANQTSGSEMQKFLASTVLSSIQEGTLELRNQGANRALYGQNISHPDHLRASMMVEFAIHPDGRLGLLRAALRDMITNTTVGGIACPPPDKPPVAQAKGEEPEAPMDIGADSPVKFVKEQIDLTRGETVAPESSAQGMKRLLSVRSESSGGTPPAAGPAKRLRPGTPEAPEGIAGASGARPAEEASPVFTQADFHRNMRVGATLYQRGWTANEVAEFKCEPAHLALLLDTHRADTALVTELEEHIKAREGLGEMLGNYLFVSTNVTGGLQVIPKELLSSPTFHTPSSWSREFTAPLPEGIPPPAIEAARTKLKELPKQNQQKAWEQACAPVAKKLIEEENLTNDELRSLTWKKLESYFANDKPTLRALRQRTTYLHQPMKSGDLVFPTVPAGMTLTDYLRNLYATHLPAAPAAVGRAAVAGEPQ